MDAGWWNWLEVARLVAGLFTPMALAAFGLYIHRVTKRFEHLQWRSQKLVEKRLAVYDDLAPDLNDLLCYFTFRGTWRDVEPPAIVQLKRIVDKKIHLAAPLFSSKFFSACMSFQEICYHTHTGWGHDATLKADPGTRKEVFQGEWNPEWGECFAKSVADPVLVLNAYTHVMEAFARDIGVNPLFLTQKSG